MRHQPMVPLGIVEDVLEEDGVPWRYADMWESARLPDLDDVSGVVILGGTMNVDQLEEHPYLGPLRDFTRAAVRSDTPVLGICLGAQIMTRALDAEVFRLDTRQVGFSELHATPAGATDHVVAPFAPTSLALQFHEDACSLPDGAELLFEDDGSGAPAFRAGDRAYAIQFHFEVREAQIADWCDDIPDFEASWGTTKDALLRQAKDHLAAQQVAGRALTRRFLGLVRDR